MAEGAQYIECDSSGLVLHADSSALECLNALLVVDNTGKYGFRVANRSVAAGNLSLAISCGSPLLTIEEILKKVIVESASGKPALSLIEEA
jgi:hypothetical protein